MQEKKLQIGLLTFSRKDIKYYFILGLSLMSVLWIWGYVNILNSNGYAFAQKYISVNPTVSENLGEIKSSRPGFSNFKSGYGAGIWEMKFQIVLEGTKDSGYVTFRLRGSNDNWTVEEATLQTKDHGEAKL